MHIKLCSAVEVRCLFQADHQALEDSAALGRRRVVHKQAVRCTGPSCRAPIAAAASDVSLAELKASSMMFAV